MEAYPDEFEELSEWTQRTIQRDESDSNSFSVAPGVVVEGRWRDSSSRGSVLKIIIDREYYDIPELEAGDSLRDIGDEFEQLESAIEKYANGDMGSFEYTPSFDNENVIFFEYK